MSRYLLTILSCLFLIPLLAQGTPVHPFTPDLPRAAEQTNAQNPHSVNIKTLYELNIQPNLSVKQDNILHYALKLHLVVEDSSGAVLQLTNAYIVTPQNKRLREIKDLFLSQQRDRNQYFYLHSADNDTSLVFLDIPYKQRQSLLQLDYLLLYPDGFSQPRTTLIPLYAESPQDRLYPKK